MSQPIWPSTLPAPLVEGYALATTNHIVSTELASGLLVQRSFAPNPPSRLTLTWRDCSDPIALIEAWLLQTAGLGWWTLPLSTPSSGVGLLDHDVRRLGTLGPRRRLPGDRWELSITIEVREQDTLNAETLEALLAYRLTDFQTAAGAADALADYTATLPECACT